MPITLSPEMRNVLLAVLALALILLLAIRFVRSRRTSSHAPRRVSAPQPRVSRVEAVSPKEWAEDFERTVSELLGIDPASAASRSRLNVDGPASTNGASGNGFHTPVPNVAEPVHGLDRPLPPGTRPYAGHARAPYAAMPATALDPGADATLQLLPGRLEALSGYSGHEIRFVHRNGPARFTFGRSPGNPLEHIQLRARTVSRMHAFMEFVNGEWHIGNLSETNAVIVNGTPVRGEDTVVLRDGDYVEMGEVVLVFRER